MSGAIGISDTQTWFTNGWGWRQLVDQAVAVAPPQYRDHLAGYRVQPGLTLSLQAEPDRVPIARVIRQAAEELAQRYGQSESAYERGYAERLRGLVASLDTEIARLQHAD